MKTPLATLMLFVLLLTSLLPIGAQDTASQLDLIPELEPITAANASRLQPLAMLGVDLINDAAWSPDSRTVVVAGTAGLWRYDTQQEDTQPQLMEGYSGLFRSVAYSAKGVLATGSDQGVLRFWDTTTWTESERIQASDRSIERLAFSPDGTLLAVGTETGIVTLWDVATQKILQTWSPADPYQSLYPDVFDSHIQDMTFSTDSTMLAVINWDGSWLLKVGTGEEQQLGDFGGSTIAFSLDQRVIAIGRRQHGGPELLIPMELWNVEKGERIKEIYSDGDSIIGAGSFHTFVFNTKNNLFVGDGRERIIVWQLDDLLKLPDDQQFWGEDGPYGEAFANANDLKHRTLPGGDFFRLSPDETTLAVVNNISVQLVDVETGTQTASIQLPNTDSVEGEPVMRIAFSPTQPLIAYSNGNAIRLIDTETGLSKSVLTGHEAGIMPILFSHDGRWLFSGGGADLSVYGGPEGEEEAVRVWNVEQQDQQAALHGGYEDRAVTFLDVSANDQWIASASYRGNAQVWNWQTNQRLNARDENVKYVTFSPRKPMGAIIINDHADAKSRALLWDIQRNLYVTLFESQDGQIGDPQFSPDGTLLAIPYNGAVHIWNVKTGQTVGGFGEGVWDFTFSPDGKKLAYTQEGGITLVEIAYGQEQVQITTITGYVSPLFFSADGSLVFYNDDLWDTKTGALRATVNAGTRLYGIYGDAYTIAAMSPDSKLIAISMSSGVRLWGVPKP